MATFSIHDTNREDVRVFVAEDMPLGHLLLALLETSEVVLNEEGGVELPNRDIIIA